MSWCSKHWSFGTVMCFLLAIVSSGRAQTYTMVDLGSFGSTDSNALAINVHNQVTASVTCFLVRPLKRSNLAVALWNADRNALK